MENMKHQSMEREYEMLHKEIETNTADLLKFANIYFPLAITILGFSIKLGESWLSLAVFIFAYIMITSQIRYRKSTFRNAAYCELLLEPHIGRSWEQNLYKMEVLDQYENRNILPRTFSKYKWRFFEWVLIEVVAGFCYFKLQQTMTGEIFILKLNTAVFCIMITLVFVSIVKIIWISNIVARKTEEREKWKKVINVSMEDLEQMNNKKNVDAKKSSIHKVEGYNNIAYRKVNEYSKQEQLKKELIDSIPNEGNRMDNLLKIQFDLKRNLESEMKGKEITLSIHYPAAVFFISIILSFIGGLLIGEFSNSMPFMIGLLIVCAVALSYTLWLVHRTRKLHENRTNNIEFYETLKEIVEDMIRKEELKNI